MSTVAALPSALLAELIDVVGAAHVLTEPDVIAGYATDWTGRFVGTTPAVVRPGTTDGVAAVVRACAAHGVAVVPQGGNTGLVGGSVPLEGEVVLSLTRLAELDAVDMAASQVTAGAGVSITALHAAAAVLDLAYGIDLASRDSATVGGTVATNAGGLRVLRYGDTRAQVVGIEAVLGDGSVVSHLTGLTRDNTGYHLPSLLTGSEGTLGLVTRARLRLVPATTDQTVALLAFASTDDAVASIAALRASCATVEAIELFLPSGVALVCEMAGVAPPFASTEGHGAYLLVEAADRRDTGADLAESVASLERVLDVAVAVDAPRRAALWAYREQHTEAINRVGTPHKLDVALPLRALATFLDEVPDVIAAAFPRAQTWLFGHAADGNVHVNVTGVDPSDERVDDAVLHYTASLGGSISAEHGIGRAKAKWLHLNRSDAELAAFRSVKRALDPHGILNPGVLFPSPG
ncbi:MAG TPA: FAD-binding oxidoreductase [Acidimicrobiia bacterium]|nr:FAD-binding oxidoreductase [Acidimicrobiia bacterium]